MIRQIALLILLSTPISNVLLAQDTTAYEIQRTKINGLLAERSAKFGQYDESLKARTGIFGFQTKRDVKNSNDILRQIALTDNNIFKELKILLDYKDLQVEQAITSSSNTNESILNYRKTIKDLQAQNQILEHQIKDAKTANNIAYVLAILFFIACVLLAYNLNQQLKLRKQHQKGK
jgi:hypothetical protein